MLERLLFDDFRLSQTTASRDSLRYDVLIAELGHRFKSLWMRAFRTSVRIAPCYPFVVRWQARRYRPRVALASTLASALW